MAIKKQNEIALPWQINICRLANEEIEIEKASSRFIQCSEDSKRNRGLKEKNEGKKSTSSR